MTEDIIIVEQYSIKEIIEGKFNEVHEHLNKIEVQTTKTNGRVSSLEKSRVQVWTAIAVLLVLGSGIIGLAVSAIDSKIDRGIQAAFDNKFSKIEVINPN